MAAAGAMFSKTLAKKVLQIFGFRLLLTVNAFVGSAFLAVNGLFSTATPYWLIMAVLFLGGVFRSLQFTSLNAVAYADVSNRDMSYATSLSAVSQQLALSVGVALGAFALESAARFRGGGAITAADFAPAFWIVAAVSALSGIYFARLAPDAGAEMSGHQAVKKKLPSTGLGDGTDAP